MKKLRLMAFTLLASSVALSGCFLLPSKKSSSDTSDTSGTEPTPTPTPTNDWTDADKTEMKEYMDGDVIPFITGTWTWDYDEEYECYSGSSSDTSAKVATAAFTSPWKVDSDESEEGEFEAKIVNVHTNGYVDLDVYEYEGLTYIDCYYIEELSAWDSEMVAALTEYFGEAIPFPTGGKWSNVYQNSYGLIYATTAHGYSYSALKTQYTKAGYKFYVDPEYGEYFYKKSSKGYINGYFDENSVLGIGTAAYYLSTDSPVAETFELTANTDTVLTGEDVSLTLEREGIDPGTVTYTASPATAATLKSSSSDGAVFTISVTEKTEITFTATQGDYTSSVKVIAYSEYPKPTSIAFKQTTYKVEQGKSLDLSKEFTVLPADAAGYTLTYEAIGNEGVEINQAGIVSVKSTASTSQAATIKVSYSETVYATCTVNVIEPVVSVEDIITAETFSDKPTSGYNAITYTSSTSGVAYSGYTSIQKTGTNLYIVVRKPSKTDGGYSNFSADGGTSRKCVDVTVAFYGSSTYSLAVYGSNSPIDLASLESFGGSVEALGTIDGDSLKYTFEADYRYIALVPPKGAGAASITSLTFNWK